MHLPFTLLLAPALPFTIAQSISPISPKGSKLYDNAGKQFYAKGVAYSQGTNLTDALADPNQCQVDAGFMKILGVNTINVYYVDATLDHDQCMQTFATQGIYVWLSLTTPTISIDRTDPEWTKSLFDGFAATIDAFAKYDNLLAFTVGNELINSVETTTLAPYLRAAARDMKKYRNDRGYRKIPIGYSAADIDACRQQTADYLSCGATDTSIDIFGMNIYSWCGNSSYYESGYNTLYEQFQDLAIPVLFTETGCNVVEPRDFSDVSTMLGPVFAGVFSGAIVYEWGMTASGYGIVEYANNGSTGFPTTLQDFDNLSTVFASLNPTGTALSLYTLSNTAPACPTSNEDWSVTSDTPLPTIADLQLNTVTPVTTYTTSTGTATSRKASKTSSSTSSTPAQTSQASSSSSHTGLSTGAIVGISIAGIAVVILAILAVILLLIRRRRRRRAAAISRPDEKKHVYGYDANADGDTNKAELPGHSGKAPLPKSELEAPPYPTEVKSKYEQAVELDGHERRRQSWPAELDGPGS